MNYTPEMEKAMHQSHKMGFAEYSRNLDNRLTVEKRRQQEYEKCKHIVAEIDSQIHRRIYIQVFIKYDHQYFYVILFNDIYYRRNKLFSFKTNLMRIYNLIRPERVELKLEMV